MMLPERSGTHGDHETKCVYHIDMMPVSVQVALDAAEKGEQYPLYIKLSNNMGAVLRKQELHAEVRREVL